MWDEVEAFAAPAALFNNCTNWITTRGQRHVEGIVSGWGKVAAAAATTELIHKGLAKAVICCGVAGAITPGLFRGDVVIPHAVLEYDLDASPYFKYRRISLDKDLVEKAYTLVKSEAAVYKDVIATGDRFVRSKVQQNKILEIDTEIVAVDMESAAVAEVCRIYGIPCVVIRVISDTANHKAAEDFQQFVTAKASPLLDRILTGLINII